MRFARVPVQAASAQIGAHTFRVLIAITSHADREGHAYPSLARIAEITGIDRPRVPLEIATLVNAGLIRREYRRDQAGDAAPDLYTTIAYRVEVAPEPGTPGVTHSGDLSDQYRTDDRAYFRRVLQPIPAPVN